MITVLAGDDSFAISEHLKEAERDFAGTAERVDGAALTIRDLPDILMGSSLFADRRLVIVRDLAKNTSLWTSLPDWLHRISDDIHLILVDDNIDKRTRTYKALKEQATVYELSTWSAHDQPKAEAWVMAQAKESGVALDATTTRFFVQRVGLDKWALAQALDIVSHLDVPVTRADIESVIEAHPSENIFALLETALQGDAKKVKQMIDTLEVKEDPFALFALLSSQVVQLLALTQADKSDNPEKDFGIHPFVASKLKRLGTRIGHRGVKLIGGIIAETDAELKISRGEPWLLIERALQRIATL
ncbi:DNA polymerase III subunit delta [Candidatus Saccharibacteria bacterium]|nr:DNA polymerase III subunit delta [Candidatus Saccharibacteria bacterium]